MPKSSSNLLSFPLRIRGAYTPLHAFAAGAVLLFIPLSNGFANFWQFFIRGSSAPMTPKSLLSNLALSCIFFGGITLICFLSSLPRLPARGRWLLAAGCWLLNTSDKRDFQPLPLSASLKLTLKSLVPIFATALLVNWLTGRLLELLIGAPPADQELVKCFTEGSYPLPVRIALFAGVLLQAPLVEEPLFRGVLFRGLASRYPLLPSLLISGFIFAFVHVNAATLPALWFLGTAFAWLYAKTGRLSSPILAHFLFNALNLTLLLAFPDLNL